MFTFETCIISLDRLEEHTGEPVHFECRRHGSRTAQTLDIHDKSFIVSLDQLRRIRDEINRRLVEMEAEAIAKELRAQDEAAEAESEIAVDPDRRHSLSPADRMTLGESLSAAGW